MHPNTTGWSRRTNVDSPSCSTTTRCFPQTNTKNTHYSKHKAHIGTHPLWMPCVVSVVAVFSRCRACSHGARETRRRRRCREFVYVCANLQEPNLDKHDVPTKVQTMLLRCRVNGRHKIAQSDAIYITRRAHIVLRLSVASGRSVLQRRGCQHCGARTACPS